MSERGNESLVDRVERLERETGEVRDELRRLSSKLDRALPGRDWFETRTMISKPSRRQEESQDRETGARRSFGLPSNLANLGDFRSGEWWLNKVGIGLLLFGVAFLYLLSVERGWLSPPVRIGFGLAVGVALLTIGLRIYEDRRSFAQVLLGGGIGAFYITGFAAFQLYTLVSYPVAFGFMVAVTLLALALSLRQDGASLSLIGSLGGLGTPFILYDGSEDLGGLVLYVCLILAGTVAIYFYKGWVSLLGVSFAGGWLVFLIGFASSFSYGSGLSPEDQYVLQPGVTFAWLLFWLAPAAREVLSSRNPAAWSLPTQSNSASAHLASAITPLVALAFTQEIWSLQKETLGWIALAGAVLYALAALILGRVEGGVRVSYAQALVALLLLTLALVLLLEGNALFFTLAAEGAVLHLLAKRLSDRIVSGAAHSLFFVAAVWLGVRLASDMDLAHLAVFSVPALVDIMVIALAFGVSRIVEPRFVVWIYRILAHLAFLAWLWRELSTLPGGDAYVTVTWGLYAAGLFIVGLRLDVTALVRGGMATFFLVVGKLFLIDLTQVDTVWRVLLFLGFGGLFLVLSYYLRSLWRPKDGGAEGLRG